MLDPARYLAAVARRLRRGQRRGATIAGAAALLALAGSVAAGPLPGVSIASAPRAIIASAPRAIIASAPRASIASAPRASIASAPRASIASAPRAIAELNTQRSTNGLPAGITENRTWSHDCAEHDHYMALNGTLTHFESPNAPGYTAGGAFAGQNGVLIQGANWSSGDPYESAPLHLDTLLAPRLQSTGSADAGGFSCTITFPGWTRTPPAAPTVYTYPGDGATIYSSEVAREQSWTPGDLVGLTQPARTGPYLFVLVDAPHQRAADNPAALSDATLTGPSGPVAVKTADGSTPVPSGSVATLGPYISPGGFIIPIAPLTANASYHAHVVVTFAGVRTAHDWSFTTSGLNPQSSLSPRGKVLSFSSISPEPIRIGFTRVNGAHAATLTLAPGRNARLRLQPGRWQACGAQNPTGTYAGYAHCLSILVTGTPSLSFATPMRHGHDLRFPLRFSSILRGRRATLTVTPLTVRCAPVHGCGTAAGRASTHTIALRRTTLSFPLPAIGHGIRLSLATRAFRLADAPWSAAHASRRYVSG